MYLAILFAVSLSIDAIAVGTSYGMKNIKIPPVAAGVIGIISILLSFLGLAFGSLISTVIPAQAGKFVSAGMLMVLGLWMIYDSAFSKPKPQQADNAQDKTILSIMLKTYGLSVTIIKHPVDCDFNHSKSIDFSESLYLGLMLSLDSVGSCIGLSIGSDINLIIPLLVGVFQVLFLLTGSFFAKKCAGKTIWNHHLISYLPGIILILVAGLKLF